MRYNQEDWKKAKDSALSLNNIWKQWEAANENDKYDFCVD